MIEITGPGDQPEEEAAQEKVSNLTENLKLPTGEDLCCDLCKPNYGG